MNVRKKQYSGRRQSYLLYLLTLLILCSVLTACAPEAPQSNSDTITVTDCAGRNVEVPRSPQSICCTCPFSGPLIVMFGYGEQITSSCNNMVRSNLLTMICPQVADTIVVKNSGSVNGEEILRLKTDLIFINDGVYETPDEKAKLDSLGIPYVVIGFDDLDSQLDAIMVIGRTLGQDEKAQEYVDWNKEVYQDVQRKLAGTETSTSLYHAVNEAVRTDYEGSICAEWIAMTGVNNVSLGSELKLEGEKAYTTLEQIYKWNPDMIICNEVGVDDYILTDDKWAGLSCVQRGQVYQIPVGIARMGHPTSTETPLALMWLANLLFPEDYNIDCKQELKDYYRNFYDFEIDDSMAEAIINADDMRTEKTNSSVE